LLDSWEDQSFSILSGFKEKKPSLKGLPALNLDSIKNPSLIKTIAMLIAPP